MRSKTATIIPMALFVIGLISTSLFASEPAEYIASEIVVQVQVGVTLAACDGEVTCNNAALQAVLDDVGAFDCELVFPINNNGTAFSRSYSIRLAETSNVINASTQFARLECVISVQPNYVYQVHATPTDSSYSSQWDKELIGTTNAWDLFSGNNSVVVAILDTGVDWGHQDLADNIWSNTDEIDANYIDDDNNGYVDDVRGWDFAAYQFVISSISLDDDEDGVNSYYWKPEDNDPGVDIGSIESLWLNAANIEFDPHGTHVAGIAGAVGNNTVAGDTNIVGVLWNCNLMPIKANHWEWDPSQQKWVSAFAATALSKGIRYATDNGAQVINMSLGGSSGTEGMVAQALQYAHEKGVVLCASAGNSYDMKFNYPASLPNVISVASTDENDVRSDFSTYNEMVDISAPGSNILSTLANNQYGIGNGTSMACPQVAGAAGLVIGYGQSLGKRFTPGQVEYILKNSADNIDAENPADVGYLGTGRLNVSNALTLAQTTPAMISSITIRPIDAPAEVSVTVAEHSTRDFEAIANYSDGTTEVVTDEVSWSVRPARYGLFSDLVDGRFSALQVPGDREVVFTALLEIEGDYFTGQRVVTITDDPDASPLVINGLESIDPLSANSYAAVYQDPDGVNTDVTAEVTWEIIDGTEYANFDVSQAGLLLTTSEAAEQTLVIKATYVDTVNSLVYTQTKTLLVSSTSSQVAGLYLTAPDSIIAGSSVSLTAKLIYAGENNVTDVTAFATWSASPAAAGSFVSAGLFTAGDVATETTSTLNVQYSINGQVYTAELQTTIMPAVAKAPLGLNVSDDSGQEEEDTDIDSDITCGLPGLLILSGLLFSGLLLMRKD